MAEIAPFVAPEGFVAVCLRSHDLRAAVDPLSGAVDHDDQGFALSSSDEAALEHALSIGEARSLPVLAVALGSSAVEEALRSAQALGATPLRVELVGDGHAHDEKARVRAYIDELCADERVLASAVATVMKELGEPLVVLCGDRSTDRGTGAFPAYLAHELAAAQALGLVALQVVSDSLVGERRLDAGRREILELRFPVVCSVEAAGLRLRRAALPGALEAARATIPVRQIVARQTTSARVRIVGTRPYVPRPRVVPPPSGDHRARLVALTGALNDRQAPTIIGPLGGEEAADALLAFLERNGFSDRFGEVRPQ